MKSRVTLTLNPKSIEFLDTLARRQETSRSAALEALLQEHFSRREEEELTQLAQEFFATPELTEEIAERRAWEKLGLEVLSREDD